MKNILTYANLSYTYHTNKHLKFFVIFKTGGLDST